MERKRLKFWGNFCWADESWMVGVVNLNRFSHATSAPDTDNASLLLLFLFCFIATLCVWIKMYILRTMTRKRSSTFWLISANKRKSWLRLWQALGKAEPCHLNHCIYYYWVFQNFITYEARSKLNSLFYIYLYSPQLQHFTTHSSK